MTNPALALNPVPLYAELRSDPERVSWGPALIGYGLISYAENAGNVLERAPGWSVLTVLAVAALGTLLIGWWLQLLFVGGLWMHVGSKLVGSTYPFTATAKAVGYAAVLPGVIMLPGALLALATTREGPELLMAMGFLWHLGLALWGFGRMVNAVKRLNGFTMPRTLVAGLWFPLLVIVGVLMFVAFTEG